MKGLIPHFEPKTADSAENHFPIGLMEDLESRAGIRKHIHNGRRWALGPGPAASQSGAAHLHQDVVRRELIRRDRLQSCERPGESSVYADLVPLHELILRHRLVQQGHPLGYGGCRVGPPKRQSSGDKARGDQSGSGPPVADKDRFHWVGQADQSRGCQEKPGIGDHAGHLEWGIIMQNRQEGCQGYCDK